MILRSSNPTALDRPALAPSTQSHIRLMPHRRFMKDEDMLFSITPKLLDCLHTFCQVRAEAGAPLHE
jgi:hypothetical protein